MFSAPVSAPGWLKRLSNAVNVLGMLFEFGLRMSTTLGFINCS